MINRNDIIVARLARAEEAFSLAIIAIERRYWNSAASELYYVCFHSIMALFAKNDINASTHSGLKTMFGLHFIKEGLIDVKWGKFLSNLYNARQVGDYGDFSVLSADEILPFLKEAEEFRLVIKAMLEVE